MKQMLFLIIFLFICVNSFSQNTFYQLPWQIIPWIPRHHEHDIAIYAQTEGSPVRFAVFSPDGKKIASVSGAVSTRNIKIWDFEEGSLFTTIEHSGSRVEWLEYSPDGKYLFVSDSNKHGTFYDTATWDEYFTIDRLDGTVPIAFCTNNEFFAILRNIDHRRSVAVFDLNTKSQVKEIISNNFPGYLSISPDNRFILISSISLGMLEIFYFDTGEKHLEIPFGIGTGGGAAIYSPDGRHFIYGSRIFDAQRFRELRTIQNNLSIPHKYWGNYSPAGDRIGFNSGVLLDTSGRYIHYMHLPTGGNPGSMSFSLDGQYIAYALSYGSIFIRNPETGEPLSELFIFDNDEWVWMTPDGYYNASPRGDEHLNIRIKDEAFALSQFSRAFYQPDVVRARLQGNTDPDVVRHFGDIMLSVAPPAVMTEVANSRNVSDSGIAELQIKIVDVFHKYPIEYIEVIVNGRLVGGYELARATGNHIVPGITRIINTSEQTNLMEFSLPVRLETGLNRIEVVAANEASYGVEIIEVRNQGGSSQRPDLWILSIGINDYQNMPATRPPREPGLKDLVNAVQDAKRIVSAFEAQQGRRFNRVHSLLVADGERVTPTRANILESLNFLKQAQPDDVAILFIAGHGFTADDVFYLLPSDVPIDIAGIDPDVSASINTENLLSALDIPGRKILIIDACHSGAVDNNRVIRTMKNRSTVVFSASQQQELAQESDDYGGHFTYSIVEGLHSNNNPSGRLVDLGIFITQSVEQLSRFAGRGRIEQRPSIIIPDGFANFIVAEY